MRFPTVSIDWSFAKAPVFRANVKCNYCLIYGFIFGCPGSSLPRGLFSSCGEQGLLLIVVHGLLIWRLLLFWGMGPRHEVFRSYGMWAQEYCGLQTLQHLNSWDRQASVLHGMWDLPQPGIKPVTPCIVRRILQHWSTREAPRVTIITLISGVLLCLKTECTPSYQGTRVTWAEALACGQLSPSTTCHHGPEQRGEVFSTFLLPRRLQAEWKMHGGHLGLLLRRLSWKWGIRISASNMLPEL